MVFKFTNEQSSEVTTERQKIFGKQNNYQSPNDIKKFGNHRKKNTKLI